MCIYDLNVFLFDGVSLLRLLLDLLLQGSFEELEQQVLLSLVRGVVIQGEDYRIHELCGFILGHLENQLGQIRGIGLKESRNVDKIWKLNAFW